MKTLDKSKVVPERMFRIHAGIVKRYIGMKQYWYVYAKTKAEAKDLFVNRTLMGVLNVYEVKQLTDEEKAEIESRPFLQRGIINDKESEYEKYREEQYQKHIHPYSEVANEFERYKDTYPDVTQEMVNEALKTGEVKVFSGDPDAFQDKTLVTLSYQSLLPGLPNVEKKSKVVKLEDVDWQDVATGYYRVR